MVLRTAIVKLTRYAEKDSPGEQVESARFLEGLGMEGDFHAKGGSRQLSFMSLEDRRWMESQVALGLADGLCFGRYKENIMIEANFAPEPLPGAKLQTGEAVLEISRASKHCFVQCPLFSKGRKCALAGRSLFAQVAQSGVVKIGDTVEIERETT